MSKIKFSPEQQRAIDERNTNIIVSAGAGSGKTAVLTERIKQLLLSGVKANELLVLTFTNAAAAEMKERIIKKMDEDPLLKSRTSEVDNAYVTTFDSFSLSIVKKYHDRFNLPKDLTIIDGSVLNVYKRKIIDDIFNEYYSSKNEDFLRLIVELTKKSDSTIKNEIISIASKIDSKTNRDEYLSTYIDNHFNDACFENYFDEYVKEITSRIEEIKVCISKLKEYLSEDNGNKLQEKYYFIETIKDYDEIKYHFDNIGKAIPFKNLELEPKLYYTKLKDNTTFIKEYCIYPSKQFAKEVYFDSQCYSRLIVNMLQQYYFRLDSFKKSRNAFEFHDIAKMAIQLIKENDDIRQELTDKFYEILVDEYQDTNDLQEEFISYIANHNVYMVGDIKQSIYGFRNANPSIFKKKYDAYRPCDKSIGVKIDLNKNFRSNRPVLKIINDIFDHIMDDEIGQADFKNEHQMKFGLQDYELGSNENKIHCISYPTGNKKKDNNEVELFFVAQDIAKKIQNKEQVYDPNTKEFRNCTYKDFAIIIADSKLFDRLSQLLSYNHIPNLILKNVSVTNGIIVQIIKNIIKLIALDSLNTYDEEFLKCFTGVGRSFIFDYDDEMIFDYITNNAYKNSELYQIIHKYSKKVNNISLLDLTQSIIDELDIVYKLIKIGDVENNTTRIEYLINVIKSMDQLGFTIFEFIEYFDEIFAKEETMEFTVSGEKEDKVKIMTIHKSKGLEYPIIYFIDNGKKFNISDLNSGLLYDNEVGIITPFFNSGKGKNINYFIAKKNFYNQLISEKLRVLYVALTRAREQMYIFNAIPKNDEDSLPLDGVVLNSIRESYKSFTDIYKSVGSLLRDYEELISPEELNINDEYLKPTKTDPKSFIEPIAKDIQHIENINNSYIKEQKHASKETKELLSKDNIRAMEKGTRMHEVLESCDFKNPNYDLYNEEERKVLQHFLSLDEIKNIKDGKIYKEFEFIYDVDEETQIHGIIDLMIIYDNHIDIIDYKLSHVEDENYLKQLKTYSTYIQLKTNKPVNTYLYSILGVELVKLNV